MFQLGANAGQVTVISTVTALTTEIFLIRQGDRKSAYVWTLNIEMLLQYLVILSWKLQQRIPTEKMNKSHLL